MNNAAKIILLDGPSASGKSRLKSEILAATPGLVFCPRVTTRDKRDAESDSDYHFVSASEFEKMELKEAFAAWRHFDFGMSYGLPKLPVQSAIDEGKDVLALIDLGTIEKATNCWPQALSILLYSPLAQLERRLKERGRHNQAQISERLQNAERVWSKRDLYDHTILNEDGAWDSTLAQMKAICRPAKT